MNLSPQGYATIGVLLLTVIGWLLKWWIGKSLDARFQRKEREDQEYRREQIEDAILQSQGQQVMSTCLAEILKHMITGNHIEDLEQAQRDLDSFRRENEAALLRKAAKYNLR